MTLLALKKRGEQVLLENGIEEAAHDAQALLLHLLGMPFQDFLLHADREAEKGVISSYRDLIGKRAARIPLQHITGTAYFYGYEFEVSPDVLIPRFDTEILVQAALREAEELTEKKTAASRSSQEIRVLDLCTGSGCIAVSFSLECRNTRVTASDISEAALKIAKKNAERNGAEADFRKSDLFTDIPDSFDLIICNPPYIAEDEFPALSPEVREHDPFTALYGGKDGLLFYRRIIREAPEHLLPGGSLMLEIGSSQAEAVSGLMKEWGFDGIVVLRDLSGLPRVVTGRIS